MSAASAASKFYTLSAESPKGVYEFSQLQGKVVLIVNLASQCGFTGQYDGLQKLYDQFKSQPFEILGFPCNQFGGQEPGTDDEIKSFCRMNYGVNFPIMKKSDVNGSHVNPVYDYLKNEKPGLLGITRIPWNFTKFLVDKKGNVVARYLPTSGPEGLVPTIEKLLQEE